MCVLEFFCLGHPLDGDRHVHQSAYFRVPTSLFVDESNLCLNKATKPKKRRLFGWQVEMVLALHTDMLGCLHCILHRQLFHWPIVSPLLHIHMYQLVDVSALLHTALGRFSP